MVRPGADARCFYSVFPPDADAARVLARLWRFGRRLTPPLRRRLDLSPSCRGRVPRETSVARAFGLLAADQAVAVRIKLAEVLVGAKKLSSRDITITVAVHPAEPERTGRR